MRVLFAGETAQEGPARYLLGILTWMRASVRHVPCTQRLTGARLRPRADVIILSDYPRDHASKAMQQLLVEQVKAGTGLVMIGGWSSFSAPFGGGWQGSRVETLLPVRCLGRDDRRNVASGVLVVPHPPHPILRGLPCQRPPVICGYNEVRLTPRSQVLMSARGLKPLVKNGQTSLALDRTEHPLLVIDRDPSHRTAAFMSDVSPHWCGGLVDWGVGRVKIRVARGIEIEVGDAYVRFLAQLLRWLARTL